MGRPSLGVEALSVKQDLRISPRMRDRINARAAEKGMSREAWIRLVIENALTHAVSPPRGYTPREADLSDALRSDDLFEWTRVAPALNEGQRASGRINTGHVKGGTRSKGSRWAPKHAKSRQATDRGDPSDSTTSG